MEFAQINRRMSVNGTISFVGIYPIVYTFFFFYIHSLRYTQPDFKLFLGLISAHVNRLHLTNLLFSFYCNLVPTWIVLLSVDWLTCTKADWSSLSPSMWAVSPIILGPISSTKSSKSIKPPTVRRRDVRGQEIEKGLSDKNSQGNMHLFMGANVHRTINQLTSHLDLLHNLQQLHFCRHVPHGPHAFCHVFIVQVSILIVVKLLEGLL